MYRQVIKYNYELLIFFQVVTRFLCSSSPVIYWFGAEILLQSLRAFDKDSFFEFVVSLVLLRGSRCGTIGSHLLLWYFGLYVILGYTLHCNFYPWT